MEKPVGPSKIVAVQRLQLLGCCGDITSLHIAMKARARRAGYGEKALLPLAGRPLPHWSLCLRASHHWCDARKHSYQCGNGRPASATGWLAQQESTHLVAHHPGLSSDTESVRRAAADSAPPPAQAAFRRRQSWQTS